MKPKTEFLAAAAMLALAAGAAGAQVSEETGDQAAVGAAAEADAVTAATAADIRSGVVVHDMSGGLVGTVESVDADGAVVATGNVRAKLPLASFGKNERGLVISLTKVQLEAAAAAQSPS